MVKDEALSPTKDRKKTRFFGEKKPNQSIQLEVLNKVIGEEKGIKTPKL
jgi:hypothetical protein